MNRILRRFHSVATQPVVSCSKCRFYTDEYLKWNKSPKGTVPSIHLSVTVIP